MDSMVSVSDDTQKLTAYVSTERDEAVSVMQSTLDKKTSLSAVELLQLEEIWMMETKKCELSSRETFFEAASATQR